MNKLRLHRRISPIMEQLEDRILFDASPDAVFLLPENLNECQGCLHLPSESQYLQESQKQSPTQLILIDEGIEHSQSLISSITENSNFAYEIRLLATDKNGVLQISEILETASAKYDAIHILSHGDQGEVQLGNMILSLDNIKGYSNELAGWDAGLTNNGDILIYGCNLAGSANGKTLIETISQLTDADVAASVDVTGNAEQGGDWHLESQTGQIESDLIRSHNWNGTLMLLDVPSNVSGAEDTDIPLGVTADSSLSNGGSLPDIIGTEVGFRDSLAGAATTDFTIPAGATHVRITGMGTNSNDADETDNQDDSQVTSIIVDLQTGTYSGQTTHVIALNATRSDTYAFSNITLGSASDSGTIVGNNDDGLNSVTVSLSGTTLSISETQATMDQAYLVEYLSAATGSANTIATLADFMEAGDTSSTLSLPANSNIVAITVQDALNLGPHWSHEDKGIWRVIVDLDTNLASGTLVQHTGDGESFTASFAFTNYDITSGVSVLNAASGATVVGDVTANSDTLPDFTLSVSGNDLTLTRPTDVANIFDSLVSAQVMERVAIASSAAIVGVSEAYGLWDEDLQTHTWELELPATAESGEIAISMIGRGNTSALTNENSGNARVFVDLVNQTTTGSFQITRGVTPDLVSWQNVPFGMRIFDHTDTVSNHSTIQGFADELAAVIQFDIVKLADGTQVLQVSGQSESTDAVFAEYDTLMQAQWSGKAPITITGFAPGTTFSAGSLNTETGEWEVSAADFNTLSVRPPEHASGQSLISLNFDYQGESHNLDVDVTRVADAPTLTTTNQSGETNTAVDISSAFTTSLVDTDGSETISLIELNGIAVGHTVSDGTSSFTATSGNQAVNIVSWNLATLTYTTPDDGTHTVGVRVHATDDDGFSGTTDSAETSDTFEVSTTTTNTPPVVDLNDDNTTADLDFATTFTEDGGPVNVADNDADVIDLDDNVVSLTILAAGAVDLSREFVVIGTESFDLDTDKSVVGHAIGGTSFNIDYLAATGRFTITNNAGSSAAMPQVDLDTLIRGITYENTSQNPTAGDRTLTFSATDEVGASVATDAVSTITVVAVNDAPVLPDVGDAAFGENTVNSLAQIIDGSVLLPVDVDSANFNGGSLAITYSVGGAQEDQLSINNEGTAAGQIGFDGTTITYSGSTIGTATGGSNGSDLVVNFSTADATTTAIQALLQNLTYQNTSNTPTATRTISLTLVDGDGTANGGADTSAAETVVITVNAEPDEVNLVANISAAAEPGTNGQFTLTLTGASTTDITVNYTVLASSTAVAGSDYVALSGSAVIFAGQTSVNIDVSVMDDALPENTESISIQLTGTSGVGVVVGSADTATVNISDDADNGLVSILANSSSAGEPGTDGQFTVSLDNSTDTDTVVSYVVTGTAAAGTDYATLSGSVTILAGQTSAVIDVTVLDDSLPESTETVIVTLTGTNNASIAVDGSAGTGIVNISDDSDSGMVSISATTLNAAEPGTDGQFTVSLDNATDNDTVVNYVVTGTAVAGSDYATLSGSVTILAGQTSAVIDVMVLNDSLPENIETVVVTLTSTDNTSITVDGSANTDTVNIADDGDAGQVSISATTPNASEPTTNGQFTVSMTSTTTSDTVVNYVVTGTSTAGSDYTTLSGSVTILAGQTSAIIDVTVLDDSLPESTETVVITLTGTDNASITVDGSANTDTVNIADDADAGQVSISATTPNASEPGTDGQFTVSLDNATDADTVVYFVVTGTAAEGSDFNSIGSSVTILAGQMSAVIDVAILNDGLPENIETVIVTLTGTNNTSITVDSSANTDWVNIADDSDSGLVSISATTPNASEPGTNGQFTVSLDNATDTDTAVNYVVTGTAEGGSDYTTLSGSVTILAGQTSAAIDVTVLDDSLPENIETVIVTLTGTNNASINVDSSANSDTMNISDDGDSGQVSILATTPNASEPGTSGQFTVSMSNATGSDTVVSYVVTGTASTGNDYTTLSGSVTILAGQTSAVIDITVLDDDLPENTETIIITLTNTDNASITVDGSANTDTVSIIDDGDSGLASISATTPSASEPGTNGQFTVSLDSTTDTDTVVSYVVTGTASTGNDYTTLSGSVTILAGQTSATIDVTVLDDSLPENIETVVVTLTGTDNASITVDGSANTDTVNIADDGDSGQVSILATTPNALEPGTSGQFTVSLDNATDTDTIVNYLVTGTAAGGSDYTTLSGSVTILAGQTSAAIDVAVLDDSLPENTETVIVTLTGTNNGSITVDGLANTDTVNIKDDVDAGLVSIVANSPDAGEPGTDGQFTISLDTATDTDTIVSYVVTGTANGGTDYVGLSGSVTILAGQTSAIVNVAVLDDALPENTEAVTVTLTGTDNASITVDGSASTDTVNIADDADAALVSISATTPTASELGPDGQFTVFMTSATNSDTVVNYVVTGTAAAGSDYMALSGSVTILAGQTSAAIDVAVLDDSLPENIETVIVTLTGTDNTSISVDSSANTGTVNITDDTDTGLVSISATTNAAEPGTNGQFTVSLDNATDNDTVVIYSVSGTANSGTDYTILTGSVTILAGQTSATIDVAVIDDVVPENDETVTVTLTGTNNASVVVNNSANADTVSIADDGADGATVSVSATTPNASEQGANGRYTITLSEATDNDTVINYVVITNPDLIAGEATAESDYASLAGTAVILAGQTSVTIDVSAVDDSITEIDETITVQLVSTDNTSITVDGVNDTAVVTIHDNDTGGIQPPSINNSQYGDDLSGTAESNSTVQLLDGNGNPLVDSNGNPIAVTTDVNGNWSVSDVDPDLVDGQLVTAIATDNAGNSASTTKNIGVTSQNQGVDSDPPSTPTLNNSRTGDDLGGTGEPGTTITLYGPEGNPLVDSNGAAVTTTVDPNGNWSVDDIDPDLVDGQGLTVVSTDPAGNSTSITKTVGITSQNPSVDSDLPATPNLNNSATGDDLSGTGEPGTTITLYGPDGNPLVDPNGDPITTTVDSNGNWSVSDVDPDLRDGQTVTAVSTDSAGNSASITKTVGVTSQNSSVDSEPPVLPTVETTLSGEEFSGMGEPGSVITLVDEKGDPIIDSNGNPVSVVVSEVGTWEIGSIQPSLKQGQQIIVRASDAAGNTSSTRVAVDIQSFAFDSFNNLSERTLACQVETHVIGDTYFNLITKPSINPFISGFGKPGSTLTARIYDRYGTSVAERVVEVNTSGMWTARFDGLNVQTGYQIEIEPLKDGSIVERDMFRVTSSSLFALKLGKEHDQTGRTILSNSPSISLEMMHELNNNPLTLLD